MATIPYGITIGLMDIAKLLERKSSLVEARCISPKVELSGGLLRGSFRAAKWGSNHINTDMDQENIPSS